MFQSRLDSDCFYTHCNRSMVTFSLVDPMGTLGTHAPFSVKFFHFYATFGQNMLVIALGLVTPVLEILDPPLILAPVNRTNNWIILTLKIWPRINLKGNEVPSSAAIPWWLLS